MAHDPSAERHHNAARRRSVVRDEHVIFVRDSELAFAGYGVRRAGALAGDAERALAAVEQGIERRDAFILWTRTCPMFDFLRHDPRHRARMRRTNVAR